MGKGDGHDATAELERLNTEKGVKADGGALSEYVGEDAKYLVARCDCLALWVCRFCILKSVQNLKPVKIYIQS